MPPGPGGGRGIRDLMQVVPEFWQDRWPEKTIADPIRSADDLAFVWEEKQQIVGLVCSHDLGFPAYLRELVVETGVHPQGIGTELVQAVEKALRGRHQRVLIADVWREPEGFYRSLGWDPPDAVLLTLPLNARD
jgi:predicted N-acetyltransferase YhbS